MFTADLSQRRPSELVSYKQIFSDVTRSADYANYRVLIGSVVGRTADIVDRFSTDNFTVADLLRVKTNDCRVDGEEDLDHSGGVAMRWESYCRTVALGMVLAVIIVFAVAGNII